MRGSYVFQRTLIKLGALFSYCGGPLILCDTLKPSLGKFMAFAVTFLPILPMIFGAESLFDPIPPRRVGSRNGSILEDGTGWGVRVVQLGLVGALVLLVMHGYGAWILATTLPRPDQGLYMFGLAVGIPMAGVYAYAAQKWLSRVRAPQDMFAPIEPK